ncbi:Hpt domain-containing protein [Hydrogenimonas cancrithermarum]|uniref:HPt domain-containing protein n=1 Tax=Hydrogenimonas cancrithermarum TaxID=2993563 RepID=A0ABM8FP88_9BACT|nr:Hpt domain-containing protein [Hydrogenimonas cancrithermarum]BDY13512.1 hypothetical protein HCR_18240 [Hydrogenimonas cancrithermarum]
MLIYRNDGKLYCISKNALKLAGYHDISEFLAEHEDYSELFVKRPGYIYNFENFSWISFLRNANTEQKKVLISTKDKATYECDLALEILYPIEYGEETPEFYYQIEFKNLKLSNGTEYHVPIEESAFTSIDIPSEPLAAEAPEISTTDETAAKAAETYEAPAVRFEEPAASAKHEGETPSVDFSLFEETPETAPSEKPADAPLELVDFSFESDRVEAIASEEENVEQPENAEALFESPAAVEESETGIGMKQESGSFAEKEATSPFEPLEVPEIGLKTEVPEPETMPSEENRESPTEAPAANLQPETGKIAATLGLPETMVKAFVKEFIETYYHDAPEVKAAMDAGHIHLVKKEAMKLKGIASNLMMDPLTQTLEEILSLDDETQIRKAWQNVERYIQGLSGQGIPETATSEERMTTPEKSPAEHLHPSFEEPAKPETTPSKKRLELEEIDRGETLLFDPNEAADALGLPESLIVEFVNDFITQAREEKAHFIEAYETNDIKTINEVAHKLKGVAANLRIEDMRELMEKVQHAQSLEEVEERLVAFYRKLAALEKTMAKEYA